MTFNQFLEYSKTYSVVPVFRELISDTLTPVSLYLRLRRLNNYSFLFESVEGGEQLARYSFIGVNPYQVFTFDGKECHLTQMATGFTLKIEADYFTALQDLITSYTEPDLPELPRFRGGAVGYSSYDTIREVEQLRDVPEDDLHLPEAVWAFYDEIYAFDHVKHRIILIKSVFINEGNEPKSQFKDAQSALNKMQVEIQKPMTIGDIRIKNDPISNTSREQFHEMVEKARNYIYEGDIFQVVLSQRFGIDVEGDTFMLYRALRTVNPSPYLFYLDLQNFSLIGSSPEVLVRVQADDVTVLPIAGTRPRGKNETEDLALEVELLSDEKEMAEHIMLVDLGRNDLSRIAKPGSVIVKRSAYIERYSHVMHIVSEVVSKLADDSNSIQALKYCFPAGTVSGAPKVRAMEIIDELEINKRGPYAGAVGYFDFSGNMDTCIAIRTMVAVGNKVYIQAGAGIVADSSPIAEFEETRNKAKALVESLKVAVNMTV